MGVRQAGWQAGGHAGALWGPPDPCRRCCGACRTDACRRCCVCVCVAIVAAWPVLPLLQHSSLACGQPLSTDGVMTLSPLPLSAAESQGALPNNGGFVGMRNLRGAKAAG